MSSVYCCFDICHDQKRRSSIWMNVVTVWSVSDFLLLLLLNSSQGEEIFLDMFEDEYRSMTVSGSSFALTRFPSGDVNSSDQSGTSACPCTRLFQSKPLNVEYLMMDASVLLPPTGTPLTGIDFVKRLPCGDVEKTRRVGKRGASQSQLCLTRSLGVLWSHFLCSDTCRWQLLCTSENCIKCFQ